MVNGKLLKKDRTEQLPSIIKMTKCWIKFRGFRNRECIVERLVPSAELLQLQEEIAAHSNFIISRREESYWMEESFFRRSSYLLDSGVIDPGIEISRPDNDHFGNCWRDFYVCENECETFSRHVLASQGRDSLLPYPFFCCEASDTLPLSRPPWMGFSRRRIFGGQSRKESIQKRRGYFVSFLHDGLNWKPFNSPYQPKNDVDISEALISP